MTCIKHPTSLANKENFQHSSRITLYKGNCIVNYYLRNKPHNFKTKHTRHVTWMHVLHHPEYSIVSSWLQRQKITRKGTNVSREISER